MIERRTLLKGMLVAGICAPFVVRNASVLMPIADRGLVTYEIRGEKLAEGGGPLPEPDWLQTIRVPATRKVNREALLAVARRIRPDVYWSGVVIV